MHSYGTLTETRPARQESVDKFCDPDPDLAGPVWGQSRDSLQIPREFPLGSPRLLQIFASSENSHSIQFYFSLLLNNFQEWNSNCSPSSSILASHSPESTDFDINLAPFQAAAAIALGFGLQVSAVAAELKIHRATLYNWSKNPLFVRSVETAYAEFEKHSSAPKSRRSPASL